jgi:hypothetical protein
MYSAIIFLHSLFRWLVVLSLIYAIYRAFTGFRYNKPFSGTDNAVRHWTATIAHIQLTIGIILYTQSPVIKYFWKHTKVAFQTFDITFYAIVHLLMMVSAIIIITIGSAMAKRKETDQEKFMTMLLWFTIAFFIIFIAIPWPFSPLSHRPYLR